MIPGLRELLQGVQRDVWTDRVRDAFPTAAVRYQGNVHEVFEPITGFVRGRGKSRRAALRAALRHGHRRTA